MEPLHGLANMQRRRVAQSKKEIRQLFLSDKKKEISKIWKWGSNHEQKIFFLHIDTLLF
jgi:hypothetical protein